MKIRVQLNNNIINRGAQTEEEWGRDFEIMEGIMKKMKKIIYVPYEPRLGMTFWVSDFKAVYHLSKEEIDLLGDENSFTIDSITMMPKYIVLYCE
jgi:hypothetical protein